MQHSAESSVNSFEILGVRVSAIHMRSACDRIGNAIVNGEKGYVCVCPVSTIMACQEDPEVLRMVNAATLVTPDGMPTVWIARWRGLRHVERVYGPDLMLSLCELSQEKGYRHYFYGGTPDVLERLKASLLRRFPRINICGSYSPPFRELSEEENRRIVDEINHENPHFVWVGLGSPRQDLWMGHNRSLLEAPMLLGVGAAFDFLSGTKRQAPRWIQRAGLEWLFRLICEPGRLWRRYIIGNSRFVYLLVKDHFRSG